MMRSPGDRQLGKGYDTVEAQERRSTTQEQENAATSLHEHGARQRRRGQCVRLHLKGRARRQEALAGDAARPSSIPP